MSTTFQTVSFKHTDREILEKMQQLSRPFLPAKERWPCLCRDLFLRVLKLAKRPRMKYGKGTNKGTLKVRRKCGAATVNSSVLCNRALIVLITYLR